MKFDTRMLDIPAEVATDFLPAGEAAYLSEEEVQSLIRQAAQTKGVDLMTAPTTITRADQETKFESIRDAGDGCVSGVMIHYSGSAMGFASESNFHLEIMEEQRGKVDLADVGYGGNDRSRYLVTEREDGTMLVDTVLTDATGRPLR